MGDISQQRVEFTPVGYDQVRLADDQRIYLRQRRDPKKDVATVDVRSWLWSSVTTYSIASAEAALIVSAGAARWKTPLGLKGLNRQITAVPWGRSLGVRPTDLGAGVDQRLFSFGLSGDRCAVFGSISETVTIYDADNRVVQSKVVEIGKAFQSLGLSPPAPNEKQGITRVIWAAASHHGYLYVGLSETPLGSAAIGMFDLLDGHLIRIIQADLPRLQERKSTFNPEGYLIPTFAAFDDRLVIADPEAKVLAIY
ncbi:MAG: hypothetical protein NTZ56_23780 [Acidobacteria bacterium]|nr:hypothetical protein [Acidobacteriota bacterium]